MSGLTMKVQISAVKVSFGDRVIQVLREQRRTKVWLAEQVGISKQNLNYVLRHANTPRHVAEIAESLGVQKTWLITGIGNKQKSSRHPYTKIPVLPLQVDSDHISKICERTKYLISDTSIDAACFALKVRNDSMEPEFKPGSYLIFDPNKPMRESCFVCMSLKHKPGLLFRQFHSEGDDVYFSAFNDMYRVIRNEPYIIHGVLVENRRQF